MHRDAISRNGQQPEDRTPRVLLPAGPVTLFNNINIAVVYQITNRRPALLYVNLEAAKDRTLGDPRRGEITRDLRIFRTMLLF